MTKYDEQFPTKPEHIEEGSQAWLAWKCQELRWVIMVQRREEMIRWWLYAQRIERYLQDPPYPWMVPRIRISLVRLAKQALGLIRHHKHEVEALQNKVAAFDEQLAHQTLNLPWTQLLSLERRWEELRSDNEDPRPPLWWLEKHEEKGGEE